MKLMELLVEEQSHLITENYCIGSTDATRFAILQESYDLALSNYREASDKYGADSRSAATARERLDQYTQLYHDLVAEFDRTYG
jgi:hypothetical protein